MKAFIKYTLLFSVLLASTASYSAGQVQGKRFKAWTGDCEVAHGRSVCYLEQIVRQGSNELLRAIVGYAPGKPYPTVFFELPPGIDIQAGVSLKVDKKKPIRFRGRCTQALCSAGFVLNPPMMKQFIKGKRSVISYSPGAGQQPISLPVSLMGITAGLKALK